MVAVLLRSTIYQIAPPPAVLTKPENRVFFQSVKEACTIGYRARKVCRPDTYYYTSWCLL